MLCGLILLCLTEKIVLIPFIFCNKAELKGFIALFSHIFRSNIVLLGEAVLLCVQQRLWGSLR